MSTGGRQDSSTWTHARAYLNKEEYKKKDQNSAEEEHEANGEQDEVSNEHAEAIRDEQMTPVPTLRRMVFKAAIERVVNNSFGRFTYEWQRQFKHMRHFLFRPRRKRVRNTRPQLRIVRHNKQTMAQEDGTNGTDSPAGSVFEASAGHSRLAPFQLGTQIYEGRHQSRSLEIAMMYAN